MNQEEKIKKWLAGELSDSERKELESSEEYARIEKLLNSVSNFKAPDYDVESEYQRLTEKLTIRKRTISLLERVSPLLKIAAVLVLALTLGYFSYNYFTSERTEGQWIFEQSEVYMPDSSMVALNVASRIRYSGNSWDKAREIELDGEAFFRVKKGTGFKVKTNQGTVTVLGTEFTVKDRKDYYQVSCYSGSVKVSSRDNSIILTSGKAFRMMAGKEETWTFSKKTKPDWLNGESSFQSVPFKFVVNELERQYEVSVDTQSKVDTDILFTGSFTHKNLDIALKSITLPLDLNYEINDNKIVITIEER